MLEAKADISEKAFRMDSAIKYVVFCEMSNTLFNMLLKYDTTSDGSDDNFYVGKLLLLRKDNEKLDLLIKKHPGLLQAKYQSTPLSFFSPDHKGYSLLHFALNDSRIGPWGIDYLLRNKADMHAKNDQGISPLDIANQEGDKEILAVFEKYRPISSSGLSR